MKLVKTAIICMLISALFPQINTGTGADGPLDVPFGETVILGTVNTLATGINSVGSFSLNVESTTEFSVGDEILIITMQDPTRDFSLNRTGRYETNRIQSISGDTFQLMEPLSQDFHGIDDIFHQVLKVPNYTTVNIDGTLTCASWDSQIGGVLSFRATGTVYVSDTGEIDASGSGYRGGWQSGSSHGGGMGGESYQGIGGYGGNYSNDDATEGAGGGGAAYASHPGRRGWSGGGGGGTSGSAGIGSPTRGGAGGGGAGHAGSAGGAGYGTPGSGGAGYSNNCYAEDGGDNTSGDGCVEYTGGGGGGGGSYGQSDLSVMFFGSGGGRGGVHSSYISGQGGSGGGILHAFASRFEIDGSVFSDGQNGGNGSTYSGGGGGGAGGSLFLSGIELILNGDISATGGDGGSGHYGNYAGTGGDGIIRLDFSTTFVDTNGVIQPNPNYLLTPIGIVHNPLWITNDASGPYVVSANIYGDNAIQSASVFYRVNGGSYVEVSMTTLNDTTFTANIPGQLINSVIDYYLTASDDANEFYSPASPPFNFYSFMITGFPPQNLVLTNNNDLTVDLNWEPPIDLQNLTGYIIHRSELEGFNPDGSNLVAGGLVDTSFTDTGLDFHNYYYLVGAIYDYDGITNISYTGNDILVNDEDITTLLGYVYLEGQSNHANIKVKLHPISPSSTLDSTWTNALGYFEKHINPGVYDITYEKSGYGVYNVIVDQSIITDLNLGENTLEYLGNTDISGNISGIWDGTYTITGSVTIAPGDSLTIMPGTHILFYGNYHFSVNGYLNAVGAEGDSIIFRPINYSQAYSNGYWGGIDFNDSSDDNSILKFALIEYAVDGVYWNEANATLEDARIHNSSENGIYVNGNASNPNISRINTHHNSVSGLYVYYGAPVFDFINSHHNTGYGAYYNYYSHGQTNHSIFNYNSSHGIRVSEYCWTNIDSSEVKYNGSWGVRIDRSSPWIGNTEISYNSGYGVRYNNDNNNWSTPRFFNCLVEENTSHGISLFHRTTPNSYIRNCTIRNNASIGIYLYYDNDVIIEGNTIFANHSNGIHINDNHYNDPDILHNVIIYNWGDGIYKNNIGSPTIKFNTIYGNYGDGIDLNYDSGTDIITHNIIVNNGQSGIRSNIPIEVFEYNLIYENLESPITNLGNVPIDSWDFVSFNANGDTADIYLNISEPVQFVFSDTTDFRLLFGSPAINSGDPTLFDPDETIADLGANYFDFGNPSGLQSIGYGNESITIKWNPVDRDSLVQYNVYFRHADSTSYNFASGTTDTTTTVTGLDNNETFHLTVSSQFPNTESIFSPHTSELPGLPQITISPDAFNFEVDADTIDQVLSMTNTGTRNLSVNLLKGMDSGSVRFDGSGDYLHMGNHTNHDVGAALTIESWIKRYTEGPIEFAGKHYRRYSIYIDSGNRLGMYKGYDSGNNLYQNWTTPWVLPVNEWHHVAVTWTGNVITFYADGEVVGEYNDAIANAIPGSGYNFQLGRRADEGTAYLNGHLAEVKLWNVVRTHDQIREFMTSPVNGDEPNLMGYWPLHDDYTDHSIYGRHGTSYNQTYISGDNPPTLPLLPFVLSVNNFDLAPSENVDAIFQFYNTGESGSSVFTTPIMSNDHDYGQIDFEISATYTTQVPSTPIYFSPVAPTGLPYTVVVTSATIDELEAGVGDEIAVFDGELCAGAGVFDGSFNFVITAWQGDDGQELAGFISGNPMTFRIYDNSADLEATVATSYSIGNGNFGYGQFTAVSLTSTIYQIQSIPIDGGLFNLISFNLLPRYSSASIVFGGMNDLRIVYNDTGAALIPEYSINSIGDIDFRDGFHLYSTVPDTINFEGIAITPSEWTIHVNSNQWNSIAFLGVIPLDVTTAFPDTLIDSISIVQTFDGTVWIPSLGVNTMTNLLPGYGYQMALTSDEDISFTYQTDGGMARPMAKATPDPEHFQITETGLPYTIVADIPDEELSNWHTGDELAVYDNDLCVGAAVFDGNSRMTISAWGSNLDFEVSGFTLGDDILILSWHQSANREIPMTFNSLNGNVRFGDGDFAYGEITGSSMIPTEFSLRQNYPNPFNPVTKIEYALPKDSKVTLTVYTLTGQQIATLVNETKTAGYYQVKWNGTDNSGIPVASGIYFYHLKADGFDQTHKMLLLK